METLDTVFGFIDDSLKIELDLKNVIDEWAYKHFGNDGLDMANSVFTNARDEFYKVQSTKPTN